VALNIDGSICFNMVYGSMWFMVQCGLWFNMVQYGSIAQKSPGQYVSIPQKSPNLLHVISTYIHRNGSTAWNPTSHVPDVSNVPGSVMSDLLDTYIYMIEYVYIYIDIT
jgi:hypothetical protein